MKSLKEIENEILGHVPITRDFSGSDFGIYLLTGPQSGPDNVERRIGRIVQVREEHGMYGSNIVLIRHKDDTLMQHVNQWFYKVPHALLPDMEEHFKDTYKDEPNTTYNLGGKHKRKGFIIKSKIKKGETTPLREVKKAIYQKIEEIIENNKL